MKKVMQPDLGFHSKELLARFAYERGFSINDGNLEEKFIEAMRGQIANFSKDGAYIHGKRVEAMFMDVVSDLGKCKLIKVEDGTSCISKAGEVRIPDYLLVLDDGHQLLVEVKNHYKKSVRTFNFRADDLNKLVHYSQIVNVELRIAIYWSRWNVWTLVKPEDFTINGKFLTICLDVAVKRNMFGLLGDKWIASRMPLRLVVRLQTNGGFNGNFSGTQVVDGQIVDVGLYLQAERLISELDKEIAFRLMMFGNLQVVENTTVDNDGIINIEYRFVTESYHTENNKSEFLMVNPLSSMLSTRYKKITSDGNSVSQLYAKSPLMAWSALIPEGYHGKELPLCIFVMQPNYD